MQNLAWIAVGRIENRTVTAANSVFTACLAHLNATENLQNISIKDLRKSSKGSGVLESFTANATYLC